MNEGKFPTADELAQTQTRHETMLANAESYKRQIEEAERQLLTTLEKTEELAAKIAEIETARTENPVEADLADTSIEVEKWQKIHASGVKFFGSIFAAGAAGVSAGAYLDFQDAEYLVGGSKGVIAASLIYHTVKMIKHGLDNLNQTKLRADLLQEILSQNPQ